MALVWFLEVYQAGDNVFWTAAGSDFTKYLHNLAAYAIAIVMDLKPTVQSGQFIYIYSWFFYDCPNSILFWEFWPKMSIFLASIFSVIA
jgi:hypothetical protein